MLCESTLTCYPAIGDTSSNFLTFELLLHVIEKILGFQTRLPWAPVRQVVA